MKTHTLKTDPDIFLAVKGGRKTFEIRKADRDFNVEDVLVLLETKFSGAQMKANPGEWPLEYTGRVCLRKISHILRGSVYGLAEGWCIMSFDAEFIQ